MIAKPDVSVIWWNQSRKTPSKRLKSDHISSNPGEYNLLGTWRIEVRKRHNPRKILRPTQNTCENAMQTI